MLWKKFVGALLVGAILFSCSGCGLWRQGRTGTVAQPIEGRPGCHAFITFRNGKIERASIVARNRLYVLKAQNPDGSMLFSTTDEPFEVLACGWRHGSIVCVFGD